MCNLGENGVLQPQKGDPDLEQIQFSLKSPSLL